MSSKIDFLGHILKFLNLETIQMGHNFPRNIRSKLHTGWQNIGWTPQIIEKKRWTFLIQKLYSLIFYKFYIGSCDDGGAPPNYWQNDNFLERCSKLQSVLKMYKGFQVSLTLINWSRSYRLFFWKLYSNWLMLEEPPELLTKWWFLQKSSKLRSMLKVCI